MKLIFPNGEHAQFAIEPESTALIGSDEEADVKLDLDGIGAHHARIQLNADGAWISVENAANITRVNGSLVVARTPVKGGDALLFGPVQCQVAGEVPTGEAAPPEGAMQEPDEHAAQATTVRRAIPQFVLRGVSGSTFGKHFPLYGSTVIGRQSECDICLPSDEISRRHARVSVTAEGLVVEDLDSANGTFVNGKRVRREVIEPGDELKLDTVRFLVQSSSGDAPRTPRRPTPKGPVAAPAPARPGAGKWIAIAILLVVATAAGLKLAGVY